MHVTYRTVRTLQQILFDCDPFTRERLDDLSMAEVVEIECELVDDEAFDAFFSL